MTTRLGRVAAALVLAFIGALLVQGPASAAYRWSTLYQTPRHVKAEACRTGVYKTPQGYYSKAVHWRGDARTASVSGYVQLYAYSDRYGPYTSGWKAVTRGTASSVQSTYFLANENVSVRMRVKTQYGTSPWSRAWSFGSLSLC